MINIKNLFENFRSNYILISFPPYAYLICAYACMDIIVADVVVSLFKCISTVAESVSLREKERVWPNE